MKQNLTTTKFSNDSADFSMSKFYSYSHLFPNKHRRKKTEETFEEKYILKDNAISIDNYRKQAQKIMDDYRYDGQVEDIDKLMNKQNHTIYKKERDEVAKLMNKTRMQQSPNNSTLHFDKSRINTNYNDDCGFKVIVLEDCFKNPFHSFDLLHKNKIIYESMLKNFEGREKILRKETDAKLSMHYKMMMLGSKAKVTPLIPKNLDLIVTGQPGNSKDNNTQQANEIVRRDSTSQIIGLAIIPENSTIELYAMYAYGSKNFPETREQFSWAQEGMDIILFGGLVSNKSNVIWCLDANQLEWRKMLPENVPANLRYGHTGILRGRKFYLFGGKYVQYPVFADLEIYNLDTNLWSAPPSFTTSILKLRRNHVACNVGMQMFIHGGVGEDDEYLNDCYILNYNTLRWSHLVISPESDPPYLAWHSCCLVLPSEQRLNHKLSIYKLPEVAIGKRFISRIKEKGIYIFGGKNSEEGPLVNSLWVIRIGKKPLDWIKLETNGEPPSPRFAATMNYYEEGNYLIIHGGRNDYSSNNFALNDTYIIELFKLDWIKVLTRFENNNLFVYNRCAHSGIVYSKI